MNTLISFAFAVSQWLLGHPVETSRIIAGLTGIAAGLIAIIMIRKDAEWRTLIFSRYIGTHGEFGEGWSFPVFAKHKSWLKIGFTGLSLTPSYVLYKEDKRWYRAYLTDCHYENPSADNHYSGGWRLDWRSTDADFRDRTYEYCVGIKPWNDRRTKKTRRNVVIAVEICLLLAFIGMVVFYNVHKNDSVVPPTDPTTVAAMPTEVATMEPTATAEPTLVPSEPVSIVIDTNQAPETNTEIWDWLNSHLPNVPAPDVNIPVPDWFTNLFENSDGGVVMTMDGLPGYVLILREQNTSVVVRLTEEMVPVSRISLQADNFTVSAKDFHWQVKWTGTSWDKPVSGSHGRFDVIVNPDDEMTIGWRFSLEP